MNKRTHKQYLSPLDLLVLKTTPLLSAVLETSTICEGRSSVHTVITAHSYLLVDKAIKLERVLVDQVVRLLQRQMIQNSDNDYKTSPL